MNLRRFVVASVALIISTGLVLVPAGAGAHPRPRRVVPATVTVNGARTRAAVFVRCTPGAAAGTPMPRNIVRSSVRRGWRNVRVTATFMNDRSRPVTVYGSGRKTLPPRLQLPCSGTGRVRVRVEQIVRRRVIRRTAMAAGLPVLLPATRTSVRLLHTTLIPVTFVQTAS